MPSFISRYEDGYDAYCDAQDGGGGRPRRPFSVSREECTVHFPETDADGDHMNGHGLNFRLAVSILLCTDGEDGERIKINKTRTVKAVEPNASPGGFTRQEVIAYLLKHPKTESIPALVHLLARARGLTRRVMDEAVRVEQEEMKAAQGIIDWGEMK